MPRFKLIIEYAGTRYSGWQIQKNARTVAGDIERAVQEATSAKTFELYGAGRTDAGVHALAQVAHLQLDTRLDAHTLRRALNDALPADIHILALERAPQRFHARHDAVARSYVYQISRRRTAFAKPFVWWVRDDLDVRRMQQAADAFVGRQDFTSFAAAVDEGASADVQIDGVTVADFDPLIIIRVVGSHFLWRMVRRMVGVLAGVGRGQLAPNIVPQLLAGASPLPAELTAPSSGLFLERVYYAGERVDASVSPAVFSRLAAD